MLSFALTNVAATLVGVAFPAYMSFRALETMDPADEKQWLTYWIIFSIIQSIEVFFYYIVTWIPLYYELKLALIVWLINPATRGAELIYNQYLWKILKTYASQYDPTFTSTNTGAVVLPLYASLCNVGQGAVVAVASLFFMLNVLVPPELHRELFLKAKQKAEVSPDFFKSMLGEGTDLKGAALSFFKKMTG